MEIASCFVALGGDLNNTVYREMITPAEYVVLASIHGGHDAIRDLKVHGQEPRSDAGELQRLREVYDRQVKLVNQLFAGYAPKLPTTFAQVLPQGGEGGAALAAPAGPEDQAVDTDAAAALIG